MCDVVRGVWQRPRLPTMLMWGERRSAVRRAKLDVSPVERFKVTRQLGAPQEFRVTIGVTAPPMVRKRKIIVYISTSADGFIARADGSFDWLDRPRPKGNYGMDAFYKSIDTILWGRKTCDLAVDFQKKGGSGSPFDTRLKNFVFTRHLRQSTP